MRSQGSHAEAGKPGTEPASRLWFLQSDPRASPHLVRARYRVIALKSEAHWPGRWLVRPSVAPEERVDGERCVLRLLKYSETPSPFPRQRG